MRAKGAGKFEDGTLKFTNRDLKKFNKSKWYYYISNYNIWNTIIILFFQLEINFIIITTYDDELRSI